MVYTANLSGGHMMRRTSNLKDRLPFRVTVVGVIGEEAAAFRKKSYL